MSQYKLHPVDGISTPEVSGNISPDYISTTEAVQRILGFRKEERNYPEDMYFRLPMLIIMNGAGRSGKDTLCDLISDSIGTAGMTKKISTVDNIYAALDVLFSTESRGEVLVGINSKEDGYRQLMHEFKMSWSKYCDGPSQYIVDVYNDTVKKIANREIDPVKVIFAMIREPEEIVKIRDWFSRSGVVVLTILIKRDENQWMNDADSNVTNLPEGFSYDIIVDNSGSTDQLYDSARTLSAALNQIYHSDDYRVCHRYQSEPMTPEEDVVEKDVDAHGEDYSTEVQFDPSYVTGITYQDGAAHYNLTGDETEE